MCGARLQVCRSTDREGWGELRSLAFGGQASLSDDTRETKLIVGGKIVSGGDSKPPIPSELLELPIPRRPPRSSFGTDVTRLQAAEQVPLLETTLEATQGQIDGSFSQLPYKCHLEEVASVGDGLEICPQFDSRVGINICQQQLLHGWVILVIVKTFVS